MWRRLQLYDYACCNAVQHIQFHNMYRKVKNRIVQCFKKKLGLKYNHVEYKKGVTALRIMYIHQSTMGAAKQP